MQFFDKTKHIYKKVVFKSKKNMKRVVKLITEDVMSRLNGERKFPKTIKARMNQIYNAANKRHLSSKLYHDETWNALNEYDEVIADLGYEFTYWVENGGYGDYDEYTHMPTSKTYNIRISCGDGKDIEGYIKMMAAGSVQDPFDRYDTCMVLWPA